MYISNKPPAPRPMASESADVDAADAANAEPASSCRRGDQDDCSPPPGPTLHINGPSPSSSSNPPSSSTGSLPEDSSKPRRTSFPVSFPPIFFQHSRVPSASLAASTAEGRPVPVTDPANANHTSALQKLNSKYPSAVRRHGYALEASVARSSTYSQPVLVRTYSGPPPSQGSRSTKSRQHRAPSSSRGASRRVPLPSASTPGSGGPGRPVQPTLSDVGAGTTSSSSSGTHRLNIETYGSNAQGVNMPRPYKAKKATGTTTATTTTSKLPLPWPWPLSSRQEPEEPKLPPLEAFSFKSFMADLETRGSDNDIGADLDRIAEICARSRYSLSNQYEVHVAPHGSGSSFTSGAPPSSVPRTRKGHSHSRSHSHGHGIASPTLQAITSDDENAARSSVSRRMNGGAKRRSAAYGTLETIMSSSRSSEEDKSKKKSAAELVGEVRGRAARKTWDTPSASASSAAVSTGNSGSNTDIPPGQPPQQQQNPTLTSTTADVTTITNNNKLARKKSASFATAIMDTRNDRSAAAAAKTSSSPSSSDQHNKTNNKKTRKIRKEDGETTTTTRVKPTSSALLSEPAQPQTSGSHLGVRTSRGGADGDRTGSVASAVGERGGRAVEAGGLPHLHHHQQEFPAAVAAGGRGGYSSWGAWIPWRAGQAQVRGAAGVGSHAEGSLRQLLRNGGDGQAERGVSRV